MKWIRLRIADYIVGLVSQYAVIGGWCGLCGSWIKSEIFMRAYPWGICEDCEMSDLPECKACHGTGMRNRKLKYIGFARRTCLQCGGRGTEHIEQTKRAKQNEIEF